MKNLYAIYKGDIFIDVGTSAELSKRHNLSVNTIRWYSGCNRIKNRAFKDNNLCIFRVDVLPEEKKECCL